MNQDGAAGFTGQANTDTVHAGPLVTELVTRARNGDKRSWDALVERYAPLIWSICRRYRLGDADAKDVGQAVWLQLAGQLGRIRDPAALPGWLATTTRRECIRILHAAREPQAASYSSTSRPSQTSRPGWRSRSCWWPSGTLHCAKRSPAFPAVASN